VNVYPFWLSEGRKGIRVEGPVVRHVESCGYSIDAIEVTTVLSQKKKLEVMVVAEEGFQLV
jgi:hypothetical protein